MKANASYAAIVSAIVCVILPAIQAAAPETPPVIRQLSSQDTAVRRAAVKELSPERIGGLQPGVAVRAAIIAGQDSDAWIRQSGMGGLALLANAAGLSGRERDDRFSTIARAIYEQPELRRVLEHIIREETDVRTVFAASVPFMAAFGSDAAAEAVILDRVDRLPSKYDQSRLLQSLAIGGLDGPETIARLAAYVEDDAAAVEIRRQAATLLLSAPLLPQDLYDDYLALLENRKTFADPTLLAALPRFSVSAASYLQRLLAMRATLEEELRKPPEQRTVTIYNDQFVKDKLDEAIASARERAGVR